MKQLFFLIWLMIAPGISAEELSPDKVLGATTVNTEQAKMLFDRNIKFVDVRSASAWNSSHIKDAFHLDSSRGQFTLDNLSKIAKPSEPVVIYCHSERCNKSSEMIDQARLWDYRQLYYYREGLVNWKKSGFPVATDSKPYTPPPRPTLPPELIVSNSAIKASKEPPAAEKMYKIKSDYDSNSTFVNIGDSAQIPETIYVDSSLSEKSKTVLLREVEIDQSVVVYCFDKACKNGKTLANKIVNLGYSDVAFYNEPFSKWKSLAYPVEARQVQSDVEVESNSDEVLSISTAQAKDLYENNAYFLDLGSLTDWGSGHISMALFAGVNYGGWNRKSIRKRINTSEPVVLYCRRTELCADGERYAKEMKTWGYQQVHLYKNGYEDWYKSGLPVLPRDATLDEDAKILPINKQELIQFAQNKGLVVQLTDLSQKSVNFSNTRVINLLSGEFSQSHFSEYINKEQAILITCHEALCGDSLSFARQVSSWGYKTVFNYLYNDTHENILELVKRKEQKIIDEKNNIIDLETAKSLYDSGENFVDVSDVLDWNKGHISMARHLNVTSSSEFEKLLKFWFNPSDTIIFYCAIKDCVEASVSQKLAKSWGFKNSYFFAEGFQAWESANYPVLPRKEEFEQVVLSIISPLEVRQLYQQNAYFVDIRSKDDWTKAHIPSAYFFQEIMIDGEVELNIMNDALQSTPFVKNGERENPIVIHCDVIHCDHADIIAYGFIENGFKEIYIYKEDAMNEESIVNYLNKNNYDEQLASEVKTLGSSSARKMYNNGAYFVSSYGYIPGSHFLDYRRNELSQASLKRIADYNDNIVFYCLEDLECPKAEHWTRKARAWNFKNTRYYRGGFNDWEQWGYSSQYMSNESLLSALFADGIFDGAAPIESNRPTTQVVEAQVENEIDAERAYELFQSKAKFIDLRGQEKWNEGHIPQSIVVNENIEVTQNMLDEWFKTSSAIVFYCQSTDCLDTPQLRYLDILNIPNVYVFKSGYDEWLLYDNPVEK